MIETSTRLTDILHMTLPSWEQRLGCVLSLAEHRDLFGIDTFNETIVQETPAPGTFMRQNVGFLSSLLDAGAAIVLGRDANGKILFYSVLAGACEQSRLLVPFTTPQTGAAKDVGLLFGTAVLPSLRGRKTQSKMISLRKHVLLACGYRSVQATVSPSNHHSIVNLVKDGFRVVDSRRFLDGYPRLIVEWMET